MAGIPFHFILLSVGEVLKTDYTVTPQKMQDFIVREDSFGGIRVPLADCRLALEMMEGSGFIRKYKMTDGSDGEAYYKDTRTYTSEREHLHER